MLTAKEWALRHIGCHMRGGWGWLRGRRVKARAAAIEWKSPSNEFLKYLKINCLWKSSTDSWYEGWMGAKWKVALSLHFSTSQPPLYFSMILFLTPHPRFCSLTLTDMDTSMRTGTVRTHGFKQGSGLSFSHQLTTVGWENEQSTFSWLMIFIYKILYTGIYFTDPADGRLYF